MPCYLLILHGIIKGILWQKNAMSLKLIDLTLKEARPNFQLVAQKGGFAMPRLKNGKNDAEKSSREIVEEKEVKEIVEKMFQYVNNMGFNPSIFARAITTQHPTIQQNFMRCFIECMKLWAEAKEKGWCDLRNDQTCTISAKIIKQFKEELYLPFV